MESENLFDTRINGFFRALRHGAGGHKRPLRLLEAALFQRRQARKRRRAAKAGLIVPPILITSITRKCNLDCVGCYSKALRPGAAPELSDEAFLGLFEEAVDLGVGTILLAGGEPLMRRSLLEATSRMKGLLLPVFTNGTLMDEAFMDRAASSSLVPVLSIEGEEGDTDARRGQGIHQAVLARMQALRSRGALFGASVTLNSENADLVLSPDYLAALGKAGISVLFLIEFVPASPGTAQLVLGPGQKQRLLSRPGFAALPYPVVILPGDEEAYGGCLAAGRGFIHLAADGRLEACPFAPFSDTSAESGGLAKALESPLMAEIRRHHGELTETSGGCALWNKAGWVASLGSCSPAARTARLPEKAPSSVY